MCSMTMQCNSRKPSIFANEKESSSPPKTIAHHLPMGENHTLKAGSPVQLIDDDDDDEDVS